MDLNTPNSELAELIQRPESILRVDVTNNGRVNPVQRQLQREQPQTNPFIRNNLHVLPSNGGQKKKRTKKNSKKHSTKSKSKKSNRSIGKKIRNKKM